MYPNCKLSPSSNICPLSPPADPKDIPPLATDDPWGNWRFLVKVVALELILPEAVMLPEALISVAPLILLPSKFNSSVAVWLPKLSAPPPPEL